MTTQDYHGDTNPSLAQGDPDTAADPGWQRQADDFAAERGERTSTYRIVPQADSSDSSVASSEGVDDDLSDTAQSSTDTALFGDAERDGLRMRWNDVQAGFVDDPRDCVQKADGLVSDVVRQLIDGFTEARSRLEQQWSRGEQASTEDLRVALKRYREFFDRLLAV
jgi:hypothetical protein